MLHRSSLFIQLRATTPQVQKRKGMTHFRKSLELLSIRGHITSSFDRWLPSTVYSGKYCVLKVLLYFPANQSTICLDQCPLPSAFSCLPVSSAPLLFIPLSIFLIVAFDPSQNCAHCQFSLSSFSLPPPSFCSPCFSPLHHVLKAPPKRGYEMAEYPEDRDPAMNPLERVITNSSCTLCKAHCFMIARFVNHFNDLKEEFQADSKSKRKKLEKQKAEIEGLKEKCNHMEEAIAHIK